MNAHEKTPKSKDCEETLETLKQMKKWGQLSVSKCEANRKLYFELDATEDRLGVNPEKIAEYKAIAKKREALRPSVLKCSDQMAYLSFHAFFGTEDAEKIAMSAANSHKANIKSSNAYAQAFLPNWQLIKRFTMNRNVVEMQTREDLLWRFRQQHNKCRSGSPTSLSEAKEEVKEILSNRRY